MKRKKSFMRWLAALLVAVMMFTPAMNVSAAGTYSQADMFKNSPLKGAQGAETNQLWGGLDHTFTNVCLNDAIKSPDSKWATNGWMAPYEFEGELFYFGSSPEGMGLVPVANGNEMSISVTFLVEKEVDAYGSDSSFLIDPEAAAYGGYTYYAPNSDLSTYGGRAVRAYWHFLMEWLIDNGYHIDNFILGNEVNMPNQWHFSGSPDSGNASMTATKYADAFYYMWSAVRKYTDISRCSVCVDHSWQNDNEGRGISAKEFLHIFNDRLAQHQGGVDWCVSTHLYPAQLFDTEIWIDPHNLAPNSSDARIVDGSNLSVMTTYIRDTWGSEHRVMLTEQGFTDECGREAQAACLAYTYYAALYDPMVDCFLISTENAGIADTSEGQKSLDFRIAGTLAGEVYTKIGNGNEADQQWIADVCLPVIGVSSWAEIIPNFGQNVDKTPTPSGPSAADYVDVFNAEYYFNNYPDLAGIGNDESKLFDHFYKYGMAEGRVASSEFDINVYKEYNPDLVGVYGNDNAQYYTHYINYGKAEGRTASKNSGQSAVGEYSAVFDAEYYYNNNSDVATQIGSDASVLFNHFLNYGMAEGRVASAEFDINIYKECNPDLVGVYGNDNAKYYTHYIDYGKSEGRIASKGGGQVDVGEYSVVFDAEYYYNNNSDVATQIGSDASALFNHFLNYGMAEGRVASAEFDINIYKENNYDLVEAYGNDNAQYYTHYINYGKNEGRVATGIVTEPVPDLDYSLVFDATYYADNNLDVQTVFGYDAEKLFAHFVNDGMAEGRVASASFNVRVYQAVNPDLMAAYEYDWAKYYDHYILYGMAEGRVCN